MHKDSVSKIARAHQKQELMISDLLQLAFSVKKGLSYSLANKAMINSD